MRRSICYCEPAIAQAGEKNNWKFIYTTSVLLPKGTRIKFDMVSKGREIDWEPPTHNLKAADNVIALHMEDGKSVQAKPIQAMNQIVPHFEFTLPTEISVGGSFAIILGHPKGGLKKTKSSGNRAQNNAQRRRPFLMYVDPTGKGVYGEPEVFTIDIRGNEVHHIRILAPSFVIKNRRFDVIVRFEDEFGNLTNEAPEDTLIELSYENLRENLTWKLFVPETGFLALPNLYFNETGVFTISLKNTKTKEVFRSAPIKSLPENSPGLFWGIIHGESERYDAEDSIENCLRYIRDDLALSFFATSPFESAEETPTDAWKFVSQNISEFDEDDRFTTFLGFQWVGARKEEGVRQIVFAKENKQILRKKDAKYTTLKKMYKAITPKELISIPSFTMAKGYEYDFKNFNPEFERVVEIYNAWGSSEMTKKEGNKRPIQGTGKNGVGEVAEGAIQKALKENKRFGFVAGGLDDRGIYGNFYDSDQVQYSPGMTGIIAKEHTRSALFEAIYNRNTYATTGPRIIVNFTIAGVPMGGETTTAVKPGLMVNRHVSGTVAGTTKLRTVEIIRNGKVIKTFKPNDYWIDFEFDDLEPFLKITLDNKDKLPPFAFYYIRVVQEDDHMAWSSPIWVDYVQPPKGMRKASTKVVKKVAPVIIPEELDEEDAEDELDYDDSDE